MLTRPLGARVLLLPLLGIACADLLGFEPLASEGSAGGSAGAAMRGGSGGAAAGGKGGTISTGGGGTDGGRGGGAGDGNSGEAGAGATGGDGAGGSGAASGTSGDGGDGGDGGSPEVPEWPRRGDACSVPGALACAGEASRNRFVCDGTRWIENEECPRVQDVQHLCDRRTGTCGPELCPEAGPWMCSADLLLICGPDRVSIERESCVFGCNSVELACQSLAPQERTIDRLAGNDRDRTPWPDPRIPVCFGDSAAGAAHAGARAALRRAVDTTWGRHSGASFLGWGSCAGDSAGVEIEFLEDCSGELVRVSSVGYPGSGRELRLEFCTSHFDAEGVRHPPAGGPVDVGLLGFVAKHAFGHVLGREDMSYNAATAELMDRVLNLDQYAGIALSRGDISRLQFNYGGKPPGSWFAPDGRCVAPGGAALETAACDGSGAQRWQPGADDFLHAESGQCLVSSGGSVALAPCTGNPVTEAFSARRARWIASEGRCVALVSSPAPGSSPLTTTSCDAAWPALQAFSFEFSNDGRVRIRAASGPCVKWPEVFSSTAVPELGVCGEHDLFTLMNRRLAVDGQCLQAMLVQAQPVIGFRPCNETFHQYFSLSGRLELGGNALTLTGTADAPVLELYPLYQPPISAQVFDYHF